MRRNWRKKSEQNSTKTSISWNRYCALATSHKFMMLLNITTVIFGPSVVVEECGWMDLGYQIQNIQHSEGEHYFYSNNFCEKKKTFWYDIVVRPFVFLNLRFVCYWIGVIFWLTELYIFCLSIFFFFCWEYLV